MTSPEGHRVEQVLLQRSLDRPPKAVHAGVSRPYFVQGCATVEEVAQLVDVATSSPSGDGRTSRQGWRPVDWIMVEVAVVAILPGR
jgi:hypothetical protein